MSMGDKNDVSKSDPESLGKVTVCSRKCSKRISKKKRENHQRCDSSDDEHPPQPPKRNHYKKSFRNSITSASDISHIKEQILPVVSDKGFQNILSADSKIFPNCLRTSQYCESGTRKNSTLIATVIDTSSSDSSDSLNSFRNLEQSLHIIHQTRSLLEDQPNLKNHVETNCNKRNNFQPSYTLRNLLSTPNKIEAEESFCKWEIFHSNCSTDVLSEDQYILQDIKTVIERENKLQEPTSQTETLNRHQTVNKDTFEHYSDRDNQDFYDWDKFLERWEGMRIAPASSSKLQHHELKTVKKTEECQPSTSSVIGTKRKKKAGEPSQSFPLNGQAKKRLCVADPVATKSTSFEKELEMVIHSVSSNDSKTSTTSKNKNIHKNIKIEVFGGSFPNGTNGSVLLSGSDFLSKSHNLLNDVENATGSTNNSDKIEELIAVGSNDTVMFS